MIASGVGQAHCLSRFGALIAHGICPSDPRNHRPETRQAVRLPYTRK